MRALKEVIRGVIEGTGLVIMWGIIFWIWLIVGNWIIKVGGINLFLVGIFISVIVFAFLQVKETN